jgi:hypothetical protein
MKLTENMLKNMIRLVMNKQPEEPEEDNVPQEVKDELFKRLVDKGYASLEMGHTADGVIVDEVEEGSEDYKTFGEAGLLVKHKGKFYVGEF